MADLTTEMRRVFEQLKPALLSGSDDAIHGAATAVRLAAVVSKAIDTIKDEPVDDGPVGVAVVRTRRSLTLRHQIDLLGDADHEYSCTTAEYRVAWQGVPGPDTEFVVEYRLGQLNACGELIRYRCDRYPPTPPTKARDCAVYKRFRVGGRHKLPVFSKKSD